MVIVIMIMMYCGHGDGDGGGDGDNATEIVPKADAANDCVFVGFCVEQVKCISPFSPGVATVAWVSR